MFFTTVDPSKSKDSKIYSDICGRFPTTSSRGNKHIYVMYVYDCNSILTTAMNNRNDKEMIRSFTGLTEDFKRRGIKPGFHFMDIDSSTGLNMTMTSIIINYQLVPPSNHRANNAKRAVQTFKNHLVVILYSVDKYFHLQLWERILQQA